MKYICPMHPEVQQNKEGRCPKCGMRLIKESEASLHSHQNHSHTAKTESTSFFPLFVIVGMITLVTGVLAVRDAQLQVFSWQTFMMNFMAGFFIVFSSFKFLDLKGFAEGYAEYDLLAKKWFSYGYIYPFIELALGLLFLLHINSVLLLLITFIVMIFSGFGVLVKLLKREKFQCACLGTFLKVPLTKVTLIEDFGMAGMALLMILIR